MVCVTGIALVRSGIPTHILRPALDAMGLQHGWDRIVFPRG